jgi:hypothetical protein
MRRILAVCRELGRPPSGWLDLSDDDRALLLADAELRGLGDLPHGGPRGGG